MSDIDSISTDEDQGPLFFATAEELPAGRGVRVVCGCPEHGHGGWIDVGEHLLESEIEERGDAAVGDCDNGWTLADTHGMDGITFAATRPSLALAALSTITDSVDMDDPDEWRALAAWLEISSATIDDAVKAFKGDGGRAYRGRYASRAKFAEEWLTGDDSGDTRYAAWDMLSPIVRHNIDFAGVADDLDAEHGYTFIDANPDSSANTAVLVLYDEDF